MSNESNEIKRTNIKPDQMSFVDHIVELRKRVIWTLILFVMSMAIGFYFAGEVIRFLQSQPVAEPIQMVVFDVTDAFKVYFQFSIVVGIVLTFPFAMYQVWAFVSPGLSKGERRLTLSYIPGSTILFIFGLSFAYIFLFPFIVSFMISIAERLNAQEMYGMPQYFRFLFTFVVPFGFLFQMPILILFLTRLGMITPKLLGKVRKYAYFILFVLAALITPPEVLSHILVTLPLIVLYEFSVVLARISYRSKQKRAKKEEN